MWKAWRASNCRSTFWLPFNRIETTFWLSEYMYQATSEDDRWLTNASKARHTALSSLHVELFALSAVDQFWWKTNLPSDCNWTNAPQAESEASEKLILTGRHFAPQYTLPFKRSRQNILTIENQWQKIEFFFFLPKHPFLWTSLEKKILLGSSDFLSGWNLKKFENSLK